MRDRERTPLRTARRDTRCWQGLFLVSIASALSLAGQTSRLEAVDAAGDPLVNVASADHGTIAVALYSQETFDAALAIDGELQGAEGAKQDPSKSADERPGCGIGLCCAA